MKAGAVIVARLDSSRLPGKQLRSFANRPLLDWLLDRCRSDALAGTVLATTHRAIDDPLAAFAAARGLPCFRGDLDDVAGRVLAAAESQAFTHFLRLNGDSPCVCPELFAEAVAVVTADPTLDFVTNLRPRRTYPYGVACELFRTASFRQTLARLIAPEHREHVTLYFYEHLAEFRHASLERAGAPLDQLRLTVDTAEDAAFFERFFSRVDARWPHWTLDEIVALAHDLPAPCAA